MVNMITALCGYFSGTFVSDTGGTFKSDTPGTFVSDIGGTFEVILSKMDKNLMFHICMINFWQIIHVSFLEHYNHIIAR